MRQHLFGAAAAALIAGTASVAGAAPVYTIIDLGLVGTDAASQGFRVSPDGTYVTGRSFSSIAQAYSWTQGGGLVGLPALSSPARAHAAGNGVNSAGVVVGTGSTTLSGSSPLPVIWQGGVASQLPLPAGQTAGKANDINSSNVVVGSVNTGSAERGAMYSGGTGTVITQATSLGCYLVTGFSINDGGRIVGYGVDPGNAARNVGYVLDTVTNNAFEVPPLPGRNGAIAYDVSENGYVVGSSMQNQGSGLPFIWADASGTTAIPMLAGWSNAIARGVNSNGWAVGTASNGSAVPFMYYAGQSYRLADLIQDYGTSGWNLLTGSSNSALSIADNGTITGTAVHDGATHAYAMVLVPGPGSLGLMAIGAGMVGVRRRR